MSSPRAPCGVPIVPIGVVFVPIGVVPPIVTLVKGECVQFSKLFCFSCLRNASLEK